jgi:hypothetical protein
MRTSDLRRASGVTERKSFDKAIDELHKSFKVVRSEVVYKADVHIYLGSSGKPFRR